MRNLKNELKIYIKNNLIEDKPNKKSLFNKIK